MKVPMLEADRVYGEVLKRAADAATGVLQGAGEAPDSLFDLAALIILTIATTSQSSTRTWVLALSQIEDCVLYRIREAVTLVQPQRSLVVADDARDHRVMAAAARALDQRVEQQPAQPFAAPALFDVHGILDRACVWALGAVRRQPAEGDDLRADGGHQSRVGGIVGREPRALRGGPG